MPGRGNCPNKVQQMSKGVNEILWKGEELGDKNSQYLIHTMWWLFSQEFGLRGDQEHHEMTLEDFRNMNGDDGLESVKIVVVL